MAISFKKTDNLESMFSNFANFPENIDSDPKKEANKSKKNKTVDSSK